jgi:serine-type D-Ala-D-Ala carboxypeptidase/endopeptidase (penicillin-binding protein 4)
VPDGAPVTKAAVRPPVPDTVIPKAPPLRPVTSVPGVSGRAKVTVHRPATPDREETKRPQEGMADTSDAATDAPATSARAATAAPAAPAANAAPDAPATNTAAPAAPSANAAPAVPPTSPAAPASTRPARDAAARETAIRGPAGTDAKTRDATRKAADDSPRSGPSERPGAVGRARVASTPPRNATEGRARADAIARGTAGIEAARLAARVAAEQSAHESAEHAAREQRVAQERAAREQREHAKAEQRVRAAAQATTQAEETPPHELRTKRLRADRSPVERLPAEHVRVEAAPASDRQVTEPVETPVHDARAAAAPGLDEKTKANKTTEVDETTQVASRTAADRPDSGPADGRTRGSGSDRRRRRRIATVTGVLVAVIAIAVVATVVIVKANSYSAAPPIAPAPKIDPPGPVLDGFNTSAALPTAAGLTAALARPLADKRLGSHVSVAIRDVATGRLLYGHGASSPTTPASSMKLATATAVLALRGPNYRITTRVVAGARPGEVVLIGAGDPTLAAGPRSTYPESGRLDVLADEVKRALGGVKPTRVIIDTTLFSGPATSTGWEDSDADSTYVHPIYALTTDGGRINPSKTGNSERYPNSALAAGQIFAKLLGLPATAVADGRAPRAASGASGTAPGAVLASVQSAPFVRILDTMLTDSDNVLAEFMARQVAIAAHRPASFAGAAAAVTAELVKLGLPTAGTHILDGSGVSHQDRLTPALLTALLSYDAQPDHGQFHPVFSGLPIAGWSGTLAGRFSAPTTNAAGGVLRAKTGTLDGVSALAGVVVDASGRSLAFAVMVDKVPIGLDAPAAEDAIGVALYRCGCAG